MEHEHFGHHCMPACKGSKMILLGVILLANEFYFGFNWWLIFGCLLIIKGIAMIIMKGCICHRHCCVEEKKPKKK